MSEAKRAYNMLRGYVNREWDRIKGLELAQAWQELDGRPGEAAEPSNTSSETANGVTKIVIPEGTDIKDAARQILGVNKEASFDDIRRAFEKLNRRSQPDQFAAGTEEADHALQLQRRIQWAYAVLTAETSDSEKRFRSLEID